MTVTQPWAGREICYPDPSIQARLTQVGGWNPHGEPNFRLVWGWTEKDLVWSRKAGTYDRRPKHFRQKNRWVVEAWHPAYMSPESWEREGTDWLDGHKVSLLGPFPSRGSYEYLWSAETPHAAGCEVPDVLPGGDGECKCGGGKYQALTPRLVEVLLDMVKLSKALIASKRRDFYLEQEAKKERDFDATAEDAINDAGRPFGGSYFVPMHGPSPDHWPKNKQLRFNPS